MVCFTLPFPLTAKQPTIRVFAFITPVAETAALSAGSTPEKQECPGSSLLPLTHRCHTEHGLLQ